MGGLVNVQVGQASAREAEAGGLQGILVGDEDGLCPRVGPSQFVHQVHHPFGGSGERLRGEGQIGGMSEVGLQLAGEGGREFLPHDPRPAEAQPPLGEALVGARAQAEPAADDRGSLLRPAQGGAEEQRGSGRGQVVGGGARLTSAGAAQAEARQVAVAEVAGVVDLAVADEEEAGQHGRECRKRVRWGGA